MQSQNSKQKNSIFLYSFFFLQFFISLSILFIYSAQCPLSKNYKKLQFQKIKKDRKKKKNWQHFLKKWSGKKILQPTVAFHVIVNIVNSNIVNNILELQNDAICFLCNLDMRDHVSPSYKKLEILKLKDHVTLLNCLFVHDFFNNKH